MKPENQTKIKALIFVIGILLLIPVSLSEELIEDDLIFGESDYVIGEDYVFDNIEYPCQKTACIEKSCVGDNCIPYLECDENDECEEISCKELGFVESQCIKEVVKSVNIKGNLFEYSYDSDGEVNEIKRNGELIFSLTCNSEFCEHFEDGETYYYSIPESFCDGIDDNSNRVVDENCDQDGDFYVNNEMECEDKFYSDANAVNVNQDTQSILRLGSGWNFVSFPVEQKIPISELKLSNGITPIFIGDIYTYSGTAWLKVNEVEKGKGYILYAPANLEFDLTKYGLSSEIEINLKDGWNLVPQVSGNPYEVYAKAEAVWIGGMLWNSGIVANPTRSMWVWWDSEKTISCLREDCDDFDEGKKEEC